MTRFGMSEVKFLSQLVNKDIALLIRLIITCSGQKCTQDSWLK